MDTLSVVPELPVHNYVDSDVICVVSDCDAVDQISIPHRAVKHPALRVFHKCENLICVQVGLLRLQRLMEKPSSSR
ncbi:Tfiih basal transcription factor complex p44 subunit [Daphnia magna]|uniref:Tfiih basal transcription factor complex p44 subunit n=1 Tax=Daphnia magna TaxID=35525 RepID=A0A164J8J0_9CRUS|nr:Tfiih basal transcription factor complex p44 subunit [Daphnia magna]